MSHMNRLSFWNWKVMGTKKSPFKPTSDEMWNVLIMDGYSQGGASQEAQW